MWRWPGCTYQCNSPACYAMLQVTAQQFNEKDYISTGECAIPSRVQSGTGGHRPACKRALTFVCAAQSLECSLIISMSQLCSVNVAYRRVLPIAPSWKLTVRLILRCCAAISEVQKLRGVPTLPCVRLRGGRGEGGSVCVGGGARGSGP